MNAAGKRARTDTPTLHCSPVYANRRRRDHSLSSPLSDPARPPAPAPRCPSRSPPLPCLAVHLYRPTSLAFLAWKCQERCPGIFIPEHRSLPHPSILIRSDNFPNLHLRLPSVTNTVYSSTTPYSPYSVSLVFGLVFTLDSVGEYLKHITHVCPSTLTSLNDRGRYPRSSDPSVYLQSES